MIKLEGNYTLSLRIAGASDFIEPQDLLEFLIDEAIGSQLPMFKIKFRLYSTDLLKLFNEGNKIDCIIGREDGEKLVSMALHIVTTSTAHYQDSVAIVLQGVIGDPLYLYDQSQAAYSGSSTSVIEAEARKFFKVNCKTSSSDNMNWIKTTMTPIVFINKVWECCSNKISIGISCDSIFHIQDWLNIKPNKIWNISPNSEGLAINANYSYDNESMFYNQWGGYGRSTPMFNIDTGEYSFSEPNMSKPIYSNRINRRESSPVQYNTPYLMTSNVNANYIKNRDELFGNLASLGTSSITFTYKGKYNRVSLFDQVNITLPDVNTGSGDSSHLSGYWVVTKIKTYIINLQFVQAYTVTREGLNVVKGDLK